MTTYLFLMYTNYAFTAIFAFEFVVLHVAWGPKKSARALCGHDAKVREVFLNAFSGICEVVCRLLSSVRTVKAFCRSFLHGLPNSNGSMIIPVPQLPKFSGPRWTCSYYPSRSCRYWTDLSCAFDGFIVLMSFAELLIPVRAPLSWKCENSGGHALAMKQTVLPKLFS